MRGLQGDHIRYVLANAGCKHFDVHGGPENIPVSRFSFDSKVPVTLDMWLSNMELGCWIHYMLVWRGRGIRYQGQVVQSMVSLTSSLRGQLVKCCMTFLPNILIFFVEKMIEAFAQQKLLTFFQKKKLAYIRY